MFNTFEYFIDIFTKSNNLDLAKELNETISEIVKAKNIQKAKVDENKMMEEMQEEEIYKFHKPIVEELKASKAVKALESKEMRMIEQDVIPSTPATEGLSPKGAIEAAIPSSLQPIEQTPLVIDPDKDIDIQLITYYNFLKPSELLKEEDRNEYIQHYN
jgi:hypothetical protein